MDFMITKRCNNDVIAAFCLIRATSRNIHYARMEIMHLAYLKRPKITSFVRGHV